MSIRAITFNKMTCKSEDDALIFDTFLDHINGRVRGCNLTWDSSNVFISVGYFMAQGRLLNVFGAHTVEIPPVETGDQYVQLVYEIDLSQTNTAQSFKQGDFKLLTSFDGWSSYVQEDLFDGGYVYQIPFCRMRNDVNGIHDFEALLDTVVVGEIWKQLVIENQQFRAQFVEFFEEQKILILQMIQDLEDENFVVTATFNSEIDRVQFGFENKTTVFNSDGSIIETTDTYTKKTIFNSDGSIVETKIDNLGNAKSKKTVFNSDGSITETLL